MAKKGFYNIQNTSKYDGLSFKLRFLSSWELNYMVYCDNNPDVIKWSYERKFVRYLDPFTSRVRRYKIDFYVKYRRKNGEFFKMLIEIKPPTQMFPPKIELKDRNQKSYFDAMRVYMLNVEKWKSAQTYAINNDMVFYLVNYDNNRFYYHILKELGIG